MTCGFSGARSATLDTVAALKAWQNSDTRPASTSQLFSDANALLNRCSCTPAAPCSSPAVAILCCFSKHTV